MENKKNKEILEISEDLKENFEKTFISLIENILQLEEKEDFFLEGIEEFLIYLNNIKTSENTLNAISEEELRDSYLRENETIEEIQKKFIKIFEISSDLINSIKNYEDEF